ncbi:AAA family ATPase [Streptomyces pactum]|uniref:Helix-turn-helix transcriptional regulator n=1 Tax=Streptomyces pactum TaxID=68249 RepID=A0A1S6JB40_9ACTN|nr:AAA family ATPase [Streptomyces pactum]AQS68971.1 helix-turn-helix transcriptional regulator [Streptomyces pactum]
MTGPLRERDDALALFAAETERARAGTGGLVLLRGATGTGRTAVLEAAARHAADRGLRVLRARCSPEDTGVSFAAVLQLLGPVPEFTDRAPGGDDRGSAARLWRLLRSYADEGPLMVAVDDVHLADDASRRWLVEAARRVDRLPVLLAATERSQYDIEPRPDGLTQALSPSLVRTHTLAPLSDAAAAGLVHAAFPAAGPRWTQECVRAGAGSPLLLHALLDDLGGVPPQAGAAPDCAPHLPDTCAALYPGTYPAAVSWWLNSAGPATADVARCLAALEQAWPGTVAGPANPPVGRGEAGHAPVPPGTEAGRTAAAGYAQPARPGQDAPCAGRERYAEHEEAAQDTRSAPHAQNDTRYDRWARSAGGAGPARDEWGVARDEYGRGVEPDEYAQPARHDAGGRSARRDPGGQPTFHVSEAQSVRHDPDAQPARADVEGQPVRHDLGVQSARRDAGGRSARRDPGGQPTFHVSEAQSVRHDPDAQPARDDVEEQPTRHDLDAQPPRHATDGQPPRHAPDPQPTPRAPDPQPAQPGRRAQYAEHAQGARSTSAVGRGQGPDPGSAPHAQRGRCCPPPGVPHRAAPGRSPVPARGRAAEAGTGDPVGLLAEAAGADPARVAGWLAAMTRLGLLRPDAAGRPRYAHPLLRDAVLTGWPTSRREAAHRAAAEAMLRRGDRVEAIARHLLRTPAVGLPWALRVLRDAVTVAVHDARPDDAVGYLRRVLDEPLPDDLRQRLLTELGSLEYASADTPAAIARLAEAQHLPADPRDRVRTAVALGTALAGRGEIRTAMEVLRRTEGRLSGHPDLTRTVQTAGALLSDEDLATRREVYRWLCETGEQSPELVGTAGQALLVRYAATAALISAEEAMTRVRALLAQPTDPLAEPFLLGTAAAVAQWADELDEADRLVERGLAGQHPALLHPMQHALLNTRADIAAARGDHARLLATGDAAGDPAPSRTGPSNRDAHALMALVHTGRTDEALRLADRFDLREVPENWELNRFLYARGVLRAATGDPAGALHDFLECGRRQTAREVVSPVVTPWRTAIAECRLALGAGQEALALATEELRLARVWNTPRTVGRALSVLGTATGGRRGLELAEEAVRTLRDAPADAEMELVPALLAQGRQLTAAGERGRARDCLREAAELAERKGAVRLLTLVGQALRGSGARGPVTARTGSGALTGSERRIAELAADGRTNTEIAALLHVARRTVETHLTSTYRKLRIRRRTELPGALDRGRGRVRPGDAHPVARDTAQD